MVATDEKKTCDWCGIASEDVKWTRKKGKWHLCALHRSIWIKQYTNECTTRRCKCHSSNGVRKVQGEFIWRCESCRNEERERRDKDNEKKRKWERLERKFERKIAKLTIQLKSLSPVAKPRCEECGGKKNVVLIKDKLLCRNCREKNYRSNKDPNADIYLLKKLAAMQDSKNS